MAKLKSDLKELIIRRLAQYNSPTEVQKELEETFNVEVPYNQIAHYNPDNQTSKLSGKYKELFYRERDAFLNDIKNQPLTYTGYRIRRLCEIAEELRLAGDLEGESRTIMRIHKIFQEENTPGESMQEQKGSTYNLINNHLYYRSQ